MNSQELRVVVAAFAIAGLAATLAVRHNTEVRLREKEHELNRRQTLLVELAAEQQRLSNLVVQAKAAPSDAACDNTAELDRLRSAVQALQNETNEITKRLVEHNPRHPFQDAVKQGATSYTVGLKSGVVSDAGSEEYDRNLYGLAASNRGTADARNLGSALRKYARAQGEFPANLQEAADYLYKDQPAPEYGNFELVYQGSLNDLTNIPGGAVALIRQRQPWQTPSGKWARVYTMADGNPQVVESDDNFQTWEAEHIIPPASRAQ